MIYVQVDVDFPSHPRALRAGPLGRDLWYWGLCYVRKYLTDGEVPAAALATYPEPGAEEIAERLVRLGLWERTDDGFRVCRYAEKGNQTKEAVATAVEKKRDSQDKWRAAHPQGASGHPVENRPSHMDVGKTVNSASVDNPSPSESGDKKKILSELSPSSSSSRSLRSGSDARASNGRERREQLSLRVPLGGVREAPEPGASPAHVQALLSQWLPTLDRPGAAGEVVQELPEQRAASG